MEIFKENIGGTHTLNVKGKKADGLYPRGRTVSTLCNVEESKLLDLSRNHVISNVTMIEIEICRNRSVNTQILREIRILDLQRTVLESIYFQSCISACSAC